MVKKLFLLVVLLLAFLFLCTPSQAVQIDLNYVFNSEYTPGGSTTPWLSALFEDLGDGTVQLTLTTPGLVSGEYIGGANKGSLDGGGWYFNFYDPAGTLTADNLNFEFRSGVQAAVIAVGEDAYAPNGDGGLYDIVFAWDKKSRLEAGDFAIYVISASIGESKFKLTPDMFDSLSSPDKGGGVYSSAAKVQGIPDPCDSSKTVSSWIATGGTPVPEPATMLLLGFGLIGLAGMGRRQFFKK